MRVGKVLSRGKSRCLGDKSKYGSIRKAEAGGLLWISDPVSKSKTKKGNRVVDVREDPKVPRSTVVRKGGVGDEAGCEDCPDAGLFLAY